MSYYCILHYVEMIHTATFVNEFLSTVAFQACSMHDLILPRHSCSSHFKNPRLSLQNFAVGARQVLDMLAC